MNYKVNARLVLHGLDKMTRGQRGVLARWIERQAKFIRPMHREFSSRFVARKLERI